MLVREAEAHGVLPAVWRQFRPFHDDPSFRKAEDDARSRRNAAIGFATVLRHHGDAVLAAAGDLPVMLVKGRAFAEALYPQPFLRTFTDIDLLVAPTAVRELSRILHAHGFRRGSPPDPQAREVKWLHCDQPGVMIEVHTDLVHHHGMRQAVSLAYDDLAELAGTPPAHLAIAAIHGGLDGYACVRQVVDLCQAARMLTVQQEGPLERLLERTGGRLAALVGLELAFAMFAEPRCREVAASLRSARNGRLACRLVDPLSVTSRVTPSYFLHSWRRQWFRALLKRRHPVAMETA